MLDAGAEVLLHHEAVTVRHCMGSQVIPLLSAEPTLSTSDEPHHGPSMPDVILRWLQYMTTFDVEVEYRAGALHGNADRLPRIPVHTYDCGCQA